MSIGEHDAHQGGVLPDGGGHVVDLYDAALVHGEEGNIKAVLLQPGQGVEHGVVLDGGGDEVGLALTLAQQGGADNGLVVRLAAAGGEVDLPGGSRCCR